MFRQEKSQLIAQMAAEHGTRSVGKRLHALAQLTDAELMRLWVQAGLQQGQQASGCLVAVGGYGRAELFPHSDVDVLVLLPDTADIEHNEALKTSLSVFITACWDAGLEIGSSVRTVAQCMQEAADVTVQTSLLEARFLCGDAALYAGFEAAFLSQLDARAFFNAKQLELRQRHTRFENTPYSLEPNCKESPGGLRDLQVVLWVAKAAGFGASWDDLARSGVATALEVQRIKSNYSLLSLVRARCMCSPSAVKTAWCLTCKPRWPRVWATAQSKANARARC